MKPLVIEKIRGGGTVVSESRQTVGVVKIAITESAEWRPPGLTAHGRVDVSCEDVAEGVAEEDLKGWAFDALTEFVLPEPTEASEVTASAASFDWPSVFAEGDVVRSDDQRMIGVVLVIANSGGGDRPFWELHVDAAIGGVADGVGIYEPWTVRLANDGASRAEAERLGLRGLRPPDSGPSSE